MAHWYDSLNYGTFNNQMIDRYTMLMLHKHGIIVIIHP